jgi:hypothetical protein
LDRAEVQQRKDKYGLKTESNPGDKPHERDKDYVHQTGQGHSSNKTPRALA